MSEGIYTNTINNFTTIDERFLALMQISNAAFPIGGFSHSFGMETYVFNNKLKNAEDVKILIHNFLSHSLGKCDAIAVRYACRAARDGDCKEIYEVDQLMSCIKLTREFREASLKMGKAMLRLSEAIFPNKVLEHYCNIVKLKGNGHFPVVYGTVCGCLEIDEQCAVAAFLLSSVNNLITVATKIVPLGQVESQKAVVDLYPVIIEKIKAGMEIDLTNMGSFSPALDIAGMQHEELYTRLYMS